jgi:hypothetical protein
VLFAKSISGVWQVACPNPYSVESTWFGSRNHSMVHEDVVSLSAVSPNRFARAFYAFFSSFCSMGGVSCPSFIVFLNSLMLLPSPSPSSGSFPSSSM